MSEVIQNALKDLEAGRTSTATVRTLLRDFGGQRRRANIVERIRTTLNQAGLITQPDFNSVWIDAEISFVRAPMDPKSTQQATKPGIESGNESAGAAAEPREARQLIRMLSAANRGVVSVSPQDSIEKAVTLMLSNDFSQLAVMTGSRSLKGVISWKSIGERLIQNIKLETASDAMEPAITVKDTDSLFEATNLIIANDFVFVASSQDQQIIGIVTATDLSEQFQTLSEPFLLIGQIENQIRNLTHDRFGIEELRQACNDNDPDRKARVLSVADLTFGEYIHLLQKEENWPKLSIVSDRVTFIKELEKVRDIRNDVMHFDPDGIEDEQFEQLRKFSKFLTRLERLSLGRRR